MSDSDYMCPFVKSFQEINGRWRDKPDLAVLSNLGFDIAKVVPSENRENDAWKRFNMLIQILLGVKVNTDSHNKKWGLKCVCLGAEGDYLAFIEEPFGFIKKTMKMGDRTSFVLSAKRVHSGSKTGITLHFNELDESSSHILKTVFSLYKQQYSAGASLKAASGWEETAPKLQNDSALLNLINEDTNLRSLHPFIKRIHIDFIDEDDSARKPVNMGQILSEVWIVPHAACKASSQNSSLKLTDFLGCDVQRNIQDINMVVYSSDDNVLMRSLFLQWRNRVGKFLKGVLFETRYPAFERCVFFLASSDQPKNKNVIPPDDNPDHQDAKDVKKYGDDSVSFLRSLRCLDTGMTSQEMLQSILLRVMILKDILAGERRKTESALTTLTSARKSLNELSEIISNQCDVNHQIMRLIEFAAELDRLSTSSRLSKNFKLLCRSKGGIPGEIFNFFQTKCRFPLLESFLAEWEEMRKSEKLPKGKKPDCLADLASRMRKICGEILDKFDREEANDKMDTLSRCFNDATKTDADALHEAERAIDNAIWSLVMK